MSFFTGQVPLFMLSTQLFASGVGDERWRATRVIVDPANYTKQNGTTAIVGAWLDIGIIDPTAGNPLGPAIWDLVDENGIVCATVTTDGVKGKGMARYRVPVTISTTTRLGYELKTRGQTNWDTYTQDA